MTSEDKLRRKLQFKGARRPTAQKLKGRKTTITNAFVSVLPVVNPTVEEIHEALQVLGQDPDDVRCVYCGDPSHGWDHLRPVVRESRPTGYITEIANLVPACGKCNSSKGGSDWRTWMTSVRAKRSPTSRGIADVKARVAALDCLSKWRHPIRIDFASIVGAPQWDAYWQARKEMIDQMMRCQAVADKILDSVQEHLNKFSKGKPR